MKKIKKYSFLLAFISLCLFFLLIISYMLWIHKPNVEYKDYLNSALNNIVENTNLSYGDYFYKYIDKETYYITLMNDDNTNVLTSSDAEYNEVDRYNGTVVKSEVIYDNFYNKYNVEANSVEIGYQDGRFFYFAKYASEKVLIYAFYDLRTGEFTKGQQL